MPLELSIWASQPRALEAYDFWTAFLCWFFFFLMLMLGRHPKPPSEPYSDSNCRPVFSGVSQLRSVCFALLWLWVLLSFMWKKASKLVTASSEVTWHDLVPRRHTLYKLICMIRLWFLNFNFFKCILIFSSSFNLLLLLNVFILLFWDWDSALLLLTVLWLIFTRSLIPSYIHSIYAEKQAIRDSLFIYFSKNKPWELFIREPPNSSLPTDEMVLWLPSCELRLKHSSRTYATWKWKTPADPVLRPVSLRRRTESGFP